MSKVSFSNNPETPATEVVVEQSSTPVAEVTVESVTTVTPPVTAVAIVDAPAAPVARTDSLPLFDDQNIGFEDIILPRINIVQKVGDLSEIFNPGEIVLKQSLVIHSPGKPGTPGDAPLSIVVLGFKKTQFAEKVAGGAQGILAHTEQEIAKHGGTLDYKEWQASEAAAKAGQGKALRLFQRLATALVLVEKPTQVADADHIEFPYECEGKYYALVLWSMKGTAYTHAAKAMFTARKIGHLRSGYSKNAWTLTTKSEKFGDNYAFVPVVKAGPKTSEAFGKFALTVLGLD
ncbi:MAG: hypothetical protein HOO67_01565 [Candidatus Peribacteraceae bacterium]|nr:hypothetical protein [Candidatus Peribacteraceae bacterium]